MAVQNEGHGATYTFSGVTLLPITLTIPGFTAAEIELTTLSNTSVKTAIAAALRKYGMISGEFEFDPDLYDGMPTSAGTFVITFSDSSNITFYAQVAEIGDITLANDERPIIPISWIVTNLNGTTETAPAYSAV